MVRRGWLVELDGVILTGSDEPGEGCLVRPPEGLGNPPIRTEDVTFPQRDGVRHYADWYEPRIITLEATVCAGDGCGRNCPGAREHVRNILQAWGRRCDDVELKIWTDCSDSVECEESPGSPGSPGGGELEWWPLDGPGGISVTAANSGLDLVNTGGGTIRYTGEGTGAEFASTPAGSFTIGRGLIAPDPQVAWLGAFTTPGPLSYQRFWDFETDAQVAEWFPYYGTPTPDGSLTITRNQNGPISGGSDMRWTWTGTSIRGAGTVLAPPLVGSTGTLIQVSWEAPANAPGTQWVATAIESNSGKFVTQDAPVGQTSYSVVMPVAGGMDADRVFIYLRGVTGDNTTRIDNVQVRALNTAPLPAEVVIANIRQAVSEVAAVRVVVTTNRTLQIRSSTGAVMGALGMLAPGVSYQLGLVANSVTGQVTAILYAAGGAMLNEFTATGNLTGNPISGFDVGIVSSTPSMAVTWADLKMESGRVTPIEPEGLQPPIIDRSLVGPYGVIGRPRLATVEWLRGRSGCARIQLRFDARDHRMFVLDCEGGTGEICVTAEPNIETTGRAYPRCYTGDGMCFDCDTGRESGDAVADVVGTECASPTVCFTGLLTNPVLTNEQTGETVGIFGQVRADDPPICIDTETGTATQAGVSRTHLITGNPRFRLVPGINVLRLTSTGTTDNGNVEVCYRPHVVSA